MHVCVRVFNALNIQFEGNAVILVVELNVLSSLH